MRSQVDSHSSTAVQTGKVCTSGIGAPAPPACGGRSAAAPSEHRPPQAGGCEPFNLPVAQSCGPAVREVATLEVSACRCKSQACCSCGVAIAFKDARLVTEVVQRMKHPMMITLTVDPEWGSPREVFDALRKRRAVAEFIRSLRKKGYITGDWYRVLEFQMGRRPGSKKTEQVHFHILVDSPENFIPHDYMMQRWHQLARLCFGPPKVGREDFGFVWFDRIKEDQRANAAYYCCKYIAEAAQKGLPDWYVSRSNEKGPKGAMYNVTLKSHSRGFFGTAETKAKPKYDEGGWCESDGPTDKCKDAIAPCKETTRDPAASRCRRTLSERLADCKRKASLLVHVFELAASGEVVDEHYIWLGEVPSFSDAFFLCVGRGSEEQEEAWHTAYGRGRLSVDPDDVDRLKANGLLRKCTPAQSVWVETVRQRDIDA